ncbi:TPA: copper chaperone PCu(A)C [Corynebacterium striatum]|nr:copper chaperone PCu(A)C [Corynebacterium striatum]
MKTRKFVLSAVAVSAVVLAGCANSEQDSTASSSQESMAATSAASSSATSGAESKHAEAGDIHIHDGVVRAMAEDSDMTAIFGSIHNGSDKDITVTGFASSIEADMYQIHEVVDGVMREKSGGLKIAAGESAELKPGGEHLMLMGVKEPVMAGEKVEVTLLLSDGSKVELGELPVREIGAGDENYGDMSGHQHGHAHGSGMSGEHMHGDHMSEAANTSEAKHAH